MAKKQTVPDRRPAGCGAVVSTDPAAFVASLLLFTTLAIVVSVFVHSEVTGIQPKESWTEVAVGVWLIASALLAVITYRMRSINRRLVDGARHAARVERFLAVGMWVIVQLHYEWQGVQTERRTWLANSKRSRRLGRRTEVTLAMDPANASRFVITALFE